jgi:hypothetical protein
MCCVSYLFFHAFNNVNKPFISITPLIADGKTGVGKSLSLAHIVHYGSSAGFVLVHVPWGKN